MDIEDLTFNGNKVMTKKLILLKSEITGKIIRYRSGMEYYREITNRSFSVNKIALDTTNYQP